MIKDLILLRRRLSMLKPWAAVAVVLGIALFSYYALLGTRYWQASSKGPSLSGKVDNLLTTVRSSAPDERTMSAELDSKERSLEVLKSLFNYPETDELVAIVSDTAEDAPVSLLSITIDDADHKVVADVDYQVQPITLTLKGETRDIYRFLSMLYDRVPVTSVAGIRIADIDKDASTQVQLLAYLSPQVVTEGEEAKK